MINSPLPTESEYIYNNELKEEYNSFVQKLIRNIIRRIGDIRFKYNDVTQKDIDFNKILSEVLANKEILTLIKKGQKMTVNGNINNNVKKATPIINKILLNNLL